MVKPLRWCAHGFKWLILLVLLGVIALAIWLHEGERSLRFVRPWIEAGLNSPEAPYTVTVGDVSIDWTDVTLLGKLHIRSVTFAKRDGSVFAQFPDIYASIDPIGFLPRRHLLHKVILRQPRLYLARNAEGLVEFGIEDSPSRMPIADLVAFINSGESETPSDQNLSLPFRDFIIDEASLKFTDEASGTVIESTPFKFGIKRRGRSYDAQLSMPFTVDSQPVGLSATYLSIPKTRDHRLSVELRQFPSRLVCMFDTCPAGVEAKGLVDGAVAMRVSETLAIHEFKAALATPKATITAPEWFAEPLKLTESNLVIEGDGTARRIALTQSKLQLEDTTITAKGQAEQREDGWYINGNAEASRLDIRKLYKYWPLFMAPDSRNWVTSKLKSGYGAKSTLKINMTPADLAAEYFSEKSIDAVVDARDITFEYLPGFPDIEKMNGIAHFTATTVKVEGSGGTVLNGTKVNHAILWCPELHSANNPMEATLDLSASASDAATILALKHFPFDDHLALNPKTIQGTIDAAMKLKFDAFSGEEGDDPNAINFDHVDYDITAKLNNVSQENVAGGYHARAVTGTLKADTKALGFTGSVILGASATNNITLAQEYGKPLKLDVKGQPAKEQPSPNDFSLIYGSGDIPQISISGKRLDASVSYGGKDNSLLADFPAMKLTIDLGELVLAAGNPLSAVKGTLNCSKTRCESASFTAKTAGGTVKGGIDKTGGVRQFTLTASDAGSFLKTLDITDRVMQGKLDLRGKYDDKQTPPLLNARLLISEFTVKNSQILGRILSIGSLTGIANMLTGSGVAFEKFAAGLISHKGVITVEKGAATGASMGITVSGKVDTNTIGLNLKGVVAPAYALNSFIGKIPLIGAIAGGSEGLIAFNYWVRGTYAEPDVGVNPLSGLTPGFLRTIFTGGGDDAATGDATPASTTPPAVNQTPAGIATPGRARRP